MAEFNAHTDASSGTLKDCFGWIEMASLPYRELISTEVEKFYANQGVARKCPEIYFRAAEAFNTLVDVLAHTGSTNLLYPL